MVMGNCQCPNFSSWKRGREALIKLVHTPDGCMSYSCEHLPPNLIPYGEVIGNSRVSDSRVGRGVRLFKEICKKINGLPELQENGLNQNLVMGWISKNFFNNPHYAYIQIRIIFFSLHIMLTFR